MKLKNQGCGATAYLLHMPHNGLAAPTRCRDPNHSDSRRSTADSSVPSTDLYDPHFGVEDPTPWVELYRVIPGLTGWSHRFTGIVRIGLERVSGTGNWHVATCIQADPTPLIPSLANAFQGCPPSLLIPLPSQPHEPSIANTKLLNPSAKLLKIMDFEAPVLPVPGYTPNFDNPENIRGLIVMTLTLCIAVVSPLVLMRLWTRFVIQKLQSWDDCKFGVHMDLKVDLSLTLTQMPFLQLGYFLSSILKVIAYKKTAVLHRIRRALISRTELWIRSTPLRHLLQ
jgi:hypothetical protein